MNCPYCDNQLPPNVTQCPACGASVQSPHSDESATPAKSRVAYIVLGLLLGWVGVHDFYAERSRSGVWHLVLFVVGCVSSCAIGVAGGGDAALHILFWTISYIWALFEIGIVTTDGKGRRLI